MKIIKTTQMNDFQKKLNLNKIYEKNDNARLQLYDNQELKILTWNIERGFDPDQLVNYILSINPDVAALQEVDWGNERTDNLDILGYIAEKTNMKGYFGIEFFEIQSPFRVGKFAGGGVHGNAILTKIKPESVYRIELPNLMDWENPPPGGEKFAKIEKRIGARFALCAEFAGRDSQLIICSTHFEDKVVGVDGRITQLNHLIESVDKRISSEGIRIIAGDLNTSDNWLTRLFGINKKKDSKDKPWQIPESVWWKTKILPNIKYNDPFPSCEWTHKFSFLYHQKLDWLLVQHTTILDKGIGDFNSSDHKPLWIKISS